jgi:hypothetical protein
MILRIEKPAVIKITDASARDATQQAGIIRRNFEEMTDSKRGKRPESIHDGTPPCRVRAVRAKEMQETMDEGSSSVQDKSAVIGPAVAINPGP